MNYAGQTLTQCLKIESATAISFDAPADAFQPAQPEKQIQSAAEMVDEDEFTAPAAAAAPAAGLPLRPPGRRILPLSF